MAASPYKVQVNSPKRFLTMSKEPRYPVHKRNPYPKLGLVILSQSCGTEYEFISAPVDVLLSNTEVRQPDVIAIHFSRMHIYRESGVVVEPPDLVIEVVSPSSVKRDKVDKRQAYAKFGVPEYWLVNPMDGTIEQYEFNPGGDSDLTRVFSEDNKMESNQMPCVSFTIDELMRRVQNLPEA